MKKTITATEYAELRGITQQAASKAIRLGHNLPGVIRKSKFGQAWALTVELTNSGKLKI